MESKYALQILVKLKKSPNRTYTTEFITKTLLDLKNLRLQIIEDQEKHNFDQITKKIKSFLKSKEENLTTTMASFDLVTASKLIPEFQGDFRDLNNYIGLIEFYHDTLKDDTQQKTLIKFILATKLSENLKNRKLSVDEKT